MVIAMNKADVSDDNDIKRIQKINRMCVITMAETELALRKAAISGVIQYTPGDSCFVINNNSKINNEQKRALDYISKKISKYGGTGVQKCIEDITFKMLDLIVVYPVEDETKFTDHFGRVLPDALLIPRGSTAKDLAYKIHTDLGNKFIRAINVRTKRSVGAEYELKYGDIIRIVSNK